MAYICNSFHERSFAVHVFLDKYVEPSDSFNAKKESAALVESVEVYVANFVKTHERIIVGTKAGITTQAQLKLDDQCQIMLFKKTPVIMTFNYSSGQTSLYTHALLECVVSTVIPNSYCHIVRHQQVIRHYVTNFGSQSCSLHHNDKKLKNTQCSRRRR